MNFLRCTTLRFAMICFIAAFLSCNNGPDQKSSVQTISPPDSVKKARKGTYAYDAAFLKKHTANVLELTSGDGMEKILLSGDYQGRVMTSSATGESGASFGWMNYNLIAAKEKKKQFNPYGGEERFWMGPEGGQYSLYFNKGDSFNIAHWQVPSFLDAEIYYLANSDRSSVTFSKKTSFSNYTGTTFNVDIQRKITLITREDAQVKLKAVVPDSIHFVGFETKNTITNSGVKDWNRVNGLVSVWLLGMFTPTPKTSIIIPFHPVKNAPDYITSNYFGAVPPERLRISDSVIYFTCDGKYRSKIGLSPHVAKPMAASFDFEKNVLTLIIPTINKSGFYVNSKWEIQKEPYKGDVINAYNDGPLSDGTQMGPFFEIESSSAALALKKGQSGVYSQTTCHFQGDYAALNQLAKQLLGVGLDSIKK